MTRACILLLAGGVLAQHSRVPISSDLCKVAIVLLLLLSARAQSRRVSVFLLGFFVFMHAGQGLLTERLSPDYAGDSLLTEVRIADFPARREDSVVLMLTPVDDPRLPRRLRVSWYEPPTVPELGDIWQLELRLRRPRGTSNPGVFDAEAWQFREKLLASGYVVGGERNRLLQSGTKSPIERLRAGFVEDAEQAAGATGAGAVLAAIGVGARHQVSREQWQGFALTGTSHLMAISGLHVGLAATAALLPMFALCAFLRSRGNHFVTAVLLSAISAGAYALVSGFAVPARRATLMLALAAVALSSRRRMDPVRILALTAALVFVTDPVATMRPGFHLSFAAVILLLWLARRRAPVARAWYARLAGLPGQLVVMQVFLLYGLLPATALFFGRIALLATPVNLLAVPLFSIVTVPLTLVGLVSGGIDTDLRHAMLRLAAHSIDWLSALIDLAVTLPLAHTPVAVVSGAMWLLVVLPLVWVLLPPGWPGRWLAPLAVTAVLAWRPPTPPVACFDATVLDVGQGLATVIRTRHATLVYDTGLKYRNGSSVAEQVILPYLERQGIDRLDYLLVSHDDLDHSGGTDVLLRRTRVGRLLLGEPLGDVAAPASQCLAGQRWSVDGIDFEVLHPDIRDLRTGNDVSCVLRVSAGRHRMLLTGDIEVPAERSLLQRRQAVAADIVVVPHHGSETSSSAPFVAAVQADLAVVSAGFGNRWGFPKPAVVARWRASGAKLLTTAEAGAVSLRVCAESGITGLRQERKRRHTFWRDAPAEHVEKGGDGGRIL